MDETLQSDLRRLVDVEAIKDVHLRYCRGIDRMDFDLVRSCYHPDAIDDHGPYKGTIEGFIDFLEDVLPSFESTTHFAGQQLVEVSGDAGWAEHYARAWHRVPATEDEPAYDWLLNLRYIDRMERRDGEWKIAYRVLAYESDRKDPVTSETTLEPDFCFGARDKTDPSYNRDPSWTR